MTIASSTIGPATAVLSPRDSAPASIRPGRFLLVSGDFVKTGGMDRANYALASYLARRGDEVHLAAYRAAEDLLAHSNVIFHRAPKPFNAYLLGNPCLQQIGRMAAARLSRAGGRVVVNGGNCAWGDVNWVHHVNAVDPPLGGGPFLRRLKNRLAHRIFVADDNRSIPRARLIITTCERTRRDLLAHVPCVRPEIIRVVYLGIDPTIFRPADSDERAAIRARLGWPTDRPTAAFIGGLGNRRKGFDILFQAWEALCREPDWDADLVVIGVGSERPMWQERAVQAGLASRVRFLGSRPDLPEILRACDGHVLPSRYEGYSMVTQEALCCGQPALVTRASGIADRYPDELSELLIPDPEDVTDLIARLRRWRERIGSAGGGWEALDAFARQLRAYTWDDMAQRILQAMDETP
jgi:glycosyltransferase involved in cell wall biosynthesis